MSGSLHLKTCARCNAIKPTDDFYARQNVCKECVKARVRENYRANRDHYVAYDKRREQEGNRKDFKATALKKHRTTHPDKYRARTAVNNAIRDGRLIRQPCQNCGTTQNVHAHHHDYSKPLDVEWLCKDCHWLEHGSVFAEAG